MKSLNKLLSFSWYCLTHRDESFWQALRNWLYEKHPYSGKRRGGIYVLVNNERYDTYEW